MFMCFEPINVVLIIWTNRFHEVPIMPRMIHIDQVANFMSNHIINNAVRSQHY